MEKARKKRPELAMEEFKLIFGSKYRQTLSEVKETLRSREPVADKYVATLVRRIDQSIFIVNQIATGPIRQFLRRVS